MADVSVINANNTDYNVKDSTARALIAELQNSVFPIGSVIMSATCSTEADVITNYGGNAWVQITDKFLMAKGSTYTTDGGSATVTLTSNNLPPHSHTQQGQITTSDTTATHKHAFTTNEQGAHTHYLSTNVNDNILRAGLTGINNSGGSIGSTNATTVATKSNGAHTHSGTTNNGGASHNHTVTLSGSTGSTGSGTAFDILPPYTTVYVWRRES